MVLLTDKNETLLAPYVEGKGSFGKHYSRDTACSASRYTEASLSALGMELFKGINKNAIDMIDNYDGTMKEPSVLPVAFPAILANRSMGVAVGFASNICSFNLAELCNATIEHIKHPKSDLLDIMPAPDFSTGGLILYNKENMREIYNTGMGAIKVRAKYTINKSINRIEIKEIPYSTTAEAIVDSIIDGCKKGRIKEINDVRDDTDKNGLTISIDYKRTCDPEQLMLKLFKITPLEDTFNCNFNVLVNNKPKCLGVYSILDEWIKFRKECVIRIYQFELDELEKRLHLLKGLEKILLNIDKAIKIIKNTEKDIDVVPNLCKAFKIDEVQGEYIANMKLRNINREYILSRTVDIKDVEKQISEHKKVIGSETEVKKIIISDLQDIIKRFGIERKSEIINTTDIVMIPEEDSIPQYDVSIFITEQNYIKKIPNNLIKENTEIKVKNDDKITLTFNDNNTGDLLIFTDKTNVYKVRLSDIPDSKPQDFGGYLNTAVGLEEDENIIFIHCTNDYKKELMIVFENGKVARIPISAYETKTNRKMLKNGFFGDSKVIAMYIVDDETKYFMLTSTKNKSLVFTNKDVPFKTTKSTQGVQMFRLTKGVVISKCDSVNVDNKKKIEKYIPNNYPAAGR
jgi:DNA gyrase subunit A